VPHTRCASGPADVGYGPSSPRSSALSTKTTPRRYSIAGAGAPGSVSHASTKRDSSSVVVTT
jgi:hypothetical protein